MASKLQIACCYIYESNDGKPAHLRRSREEEEEEKNLQENINL